MDSVMNDYTEENPIEIEIESLEAIYINELSYKRKADGTLDTIELLLHPATGDEVGKQFVCMTLVFTPSPKYPDEIPSIEIKNPRGLGEEEVASLVEDMISKAHECVGEVMLYTLIEMAKDSLTEGNIPHCPCVLCLEHFHEADLFHRTACYHYFHIKCLCRYIEHSRKQIEEEKEAEHERRHIEVLAENKEKAICCPVCRAPLGEDSLSITYDLSNIGPQEDAEESQFVLPPELREQQAKMAELFAKQKAKGGIIDLEQEKNKYLINAEDCRPVTPTVSSAQPSSQTNPEMPVNSHAQGANPYQKKHLDVNFRGGQKDWESKRDGREGSWGRGRGHHREKDGDNYYRDRNRGHHQRHQDGGRGQGRGMSRRGGSASRGSYHQGGGAVSERPASRGAKSYRDDTVPESGANGGARNFNRKEITGQESGESTDAPLPLQRSEHSGEGVDKSKKPGFDSKYQESKGCYGSNSESKNTERSRRGREGFGNRPRGRGGNSTSERNGGMVRHDRKEQYLGREGEESLAGSNDLSGKDTLSDSGNDRTRGQRAYQRGRGRGRFRDFDSAYFEVKTNTAEDGDSENFDKSLDSRKDPGTRGRDGGCKERHKQSYQRNNEHDDGGGSNHPSSRRSAGSGRSDRNHTGRPSGQDHRKGGRSGGGQGSKSAKSNNDFEMLESWNRRGDERKIEEEFEMNRRWRKLNFGYSGSKVKPGDCQVIDDDSTGRKINLNSQELSARKFDVENKVSSTYPTDGSNLKMYYVGYEEVEEEEDWDEERFTYAFERNRIRTEDLEEYDKFRRKDYDIRQKKVEERDARDRLLREEDRRMRREQAEKDRKAANSADSKPAKSVLELFQEKQEAKKREAEMLKKEQESQGGKQQKSKTETESDGGFHSDGPSASSASFETGSSFSLSSSSQGYQSQSSTEELSQQDLQQQVDSTREEANCAQAKMNAVKSVKDKKCTFGQDSSEIVWVGVKKKPEPEPSVSIKEEDENIVRPGLDEPSIDAWERREERKRVGRKKNKKKSKVPDNSSCDVSKSEMEIHTDTSMSPNTSNLRDSKLESDVITQNPSTSNQCSEATQSVTTPAARQKTMTKAPPLKLSSKRIKQGPVSTSAEGPTVAELPDLTKSEVAQLKALMCEETMEADDTSSNHEICEKKLVTEHKKDNNPICSFQGGFTQTPYTVETGNSQNNIAAQTSGSTLSFYAKTSSQNQSEAVERKKTLTVPQALTKHLKKAPPLNLKQMPTKPKSCEASGPCALPREESVMGKAGQKDITKVMKYLGIELDDENDDILKESSEADQQRVNLPLS